ncbi:MAG: glycoside hydrolase family 127 protein [Verrucomicrobiales bacterium]|nr:glycoside hydrolase family 127 protein [Verrucomicrobiales bacterium]
MKLRSITAAIPLFIILFAAIFPLNGAGDSDAGIYFNRAPLLEKRYAELPLGSIKPEGWLKHQLETMASGLTGHLDKAYEEVCGPRNAWLGGDGDAWERGPYWIDGLYPLAKLLDDKTLEAKAMKWIEWTLQNQRPNGQIGPYQLSDEDRSEAPPKGAQTGDADDWWPRMVMLKILQQHYLATGDGRALEAMLRYSRYQLSELGKRPVYDPGNPESGSWWAGRRGGDNVMSVYWLYNVTGESFLLELADLIREQSYPWVSDFESGENLKLFRYSEHHGEGNAYHCVNLAHALKYPLIFGQRKGLDEAMKVTKKTLAGIRRHHGQPHGLWGGDEGMHGTDPTRGSELCTISETLFSLEKNFEITGEVQFADLLERVAFNALPTQADEAFTTRQYFQQANQISCTHSPHPFTNHPRTSNLFGLLTGYPCCTCNMHQAWPKFTAHLWMATKDGGVAAMAYAPSTVTRSLPEEVELSIRAETGYPFKEEVKLTIDLSKPAVFPLHLRIPEWCEDATVVINDEIAIEPERGKMAVIKRRWEKGDTVQVRLPMQIRSERGHENSVSILRGPLVFALKMDEKWEKKDGYFEVRSDSPWNFSLFDRDLESGRKVMRKKFKLVQKEGPLPSNPWNTKNAPVQLEAYGVRNPLWGTYHDEAGPLPWSPAAFPKGGQPEAITLLPYGCTTLRISAFPTVL